jgi:hypothetical protein
MQLRATFTAIRRDQFIVIFERDGGHTGTSVATDALAVVAFCLQHHGNHRMIYRNLAGLWYELRHDGKTFLEVVDIAADELEGIIEECGLRY